MLNACPFLHQDAWEVARIVQVTLAALHFNADFLCSHMLVLKVGNFRHLHRLYATVDRTSDTGKPAMLSACMYHSRCIFSPWMGGAWQRASERNL